MAAKLHCSELARHNFFEAHEFQSEKAENCWGKSCSQLITSLAQGEDSPNHINNDTIVTDKEEMGAMKAKIIRHPEFRFLLEAYIRFITVGATPEIVGCLDLAVKDLENRQSEMIMNLGSDPELDVFMEAYCEMLSTVREKLEKPFMETITFFMSIEAQLNSLNSGAVNTTYSAESNERTERGGSMDEEDCSMGEEDYQWAVQHSEETELKDLLLRKYSGNLCRLKQRFMKKKKRRNLSKEARQKLLHWWELHQKWPYPSETEKMALAECTQLDPKQINNWFINQRKRHWNPYSEDIQANGHSEDL